MATGVFCWGVGTRVGSRESDEAWRGGLQGAEIRLRDWLVL